MTEEQNIVDAVELLKALIRTPSFSREEENTAALLQQYLEQRGIEVKRHMNNLWAVHASYDPQKPSVLLNSHHDTVPPNKSYTLDPFSPIEEDGKLFGLGSNDAGGPLVSLIASFLHFQNRKDLPYNVVLAATAEEEISGKNGVEALIPLLPPIDCAVVGEPTQMQLAVAERGLMVLDCIAHGKAGHAARNEGENAIYKALKDIQWLESYRFSEVSDLLGAVKMTTTSIETDNKAHNIVPSTCRFVVDVRLNECYTMEEVLETIRTGVNSEVQPRSTRLRSTSIAVTHPLIVAGKMLGRSTYGSPTTSDKALMPWQALKMGPGDSARSHTANEFIFIDEIHQGIRLYIELLEKMMQLVSQ